MDEPRARFHVGTTTRVVAGAGEVDGVGHWAATYGGRALVVVGDRHARASGLLSRVEGSLAAAGLRVELLEGVPPDPGTTAVDAGALLARSWRADVVVGVGGGSVIDAAKAIAVAAAGDARPYRERLSGIRAPGTLIEEALPVVAVPTMPGSGSETNGTSVITDDHTGRKLSAHADLAAPRIAVLDPQLVLEAPGELVAPGLVDALCHALEAAISVHATVASDLLAESAVRALLRGAEHAIDGGAPREARSTELLTAWWASNLAGQSLGMSGSIVTHPLAHPLSARFGARHGAAVAALEPAVLAVLGAERLAVRGALARVAGWMDVRAARDAEPDGEALLRGVLTRLSRFCGALGVGASIAELGLGADDVTTVVRDARASGSRGLAATPGGEPTADELFAVLDVARACGPTTSPRKLLAERDRRLAVGVDVD